MFRVSFHFALLFIKFILAFIYGLMNILSFVALKSISAGMFTICAQLKILTTALFSRLLLQRQYSYVKWRALISLMAGVIIFSESTWNNESAHQSASTATSFYLGTAAVLTEVTLSGFASIYFEKVIKSDPEQLSIWERNFQLALGSIPVYALFILNDGGGEGGYFSGWSFITVTLAFLGAAGGILVALSIKHTDSILKTLATTGAIVLSSILDHMFLGGPLNLSMTLSGTVVVNSICDYTFDPSPTTESAIIKEVSPISSDIHKKNDSYIEVPKFFPTDEKPARIDSP
jgi:UDP-sugar transporter A1/2/3